MISSIVMCGFTSVLLAIATLIIWIWGKKETSDLMPIVMWLFLLISGLWLMENVSIVGVDIRTDLDEGTVYYVHGTVEQEIFTLQKMNILSGELEGVVFLYSLEEKIELKEKIESGAKITGDRKEIRIWIPPII